MFEPCAMTFTTSAPRAACARCLEELEPDSTIVRSTRGRPPSQRSRLLHPECAIDVDTSVLCALLRSDALPFAGRAAIEELAFARERAIEQRALSQWRERHEDTGQVVAIAPSRPFEDAPEHVRPARDRRGRPRVRVLLTGTAVVDRNDTSSLFWSLLREGYSWASPKREYVFTPRVGARIAPDEDPAQPIIGVLYAPLAKKSSKLERDPSLWLFSALSMPPPLLWLHGIKAWKARDENILRVREHVARSGFDADLCPIIATPVVDAAALDALVLALDEHFDGAERRVTEHQASAIASALLRAAREDLRSIEEQRFDMMLSYALWGRTAASDAIVTALAEALIDHAAHAVGDRHSQRLAARVLANRAVSRASLFERWFANEAARGDKESSTGVSDLFDRYAECEGAAPVAQLIELAARSTHPSRTMELTRLFEKWVTEATAQPAIDALARIESPTLRVEYERLTRAWQARLQCEPRSLD